MSIDPAAATCEVGSQAQPHPCHRQRDNQTGTTRTPVLCGYSDAHFHCAPSPVALATVYLCLLPSLCSSGASGSRERSVPTVACVVAGGVRVLAVDSNPAVSTAARSGSALPNQAMAIRNIPGCSRRCAYMYGMPPLRRKPICCALPRTPCHSTDLGILPRIRPVSRLARRCWWTRPC